MINANEIVKLSQRDTIKWLEVLKGMRVTPETSEAIRQYEIHLANLQAEARRREREYVDNVVDI